MYRFLLYGVRFKLIYTTKHNINLKGKKYIKPDNWFYLYIMKCSMKY